MCSPASERLLSSTSFPCEGDREVEATNLQSHKSKQWICNLGFREDPFQRLIGGDPDADGPRRHRRRSPAVSQGYLSRAVALEASFERAILGLELEGASYQVLSCGAGFDSSYFRLKNMGVLGSNCAAYLEADYPQVVRDKVRAILANPVLLGACMMGMDLESYSRNADASSFRAGNYGAVGCDVTRTEELEQRLASIGGLDASLATVVLCECSLTYVTDRAATAFYRWVAARFANARLIVYEQVHPGDRFGRIMMSHFEQRGTPLLNASYFPTPSDQERRLRWAGFASASSTTLSNIMRLHFGDSELALRARTEPHFDEFEELFLKCSHYTVLEGTTDKDKKPLLFSPPVKQKLQQHRYPYPHVSTRPCPPSLSRYGHCYVVAGDSVYVIGGISVDKGRDGAMIKIDFAGDELVLGQALESSLNWECTAFAAACLWKSMEKNTAVIFGGRASPSEASRKVSVIDLETGKHSELKCSKETEPEPRWRHTMDFVENWNAAVVVGGRNRTKVFDDVWSLDPAARKWTGPLILPDGGVHSHASSAYGSDKVLITGGLRGDQIICDRISVLDTSSMKVSSHSGPPGMLPRFSHSCIVAGSRAYLVGGVSSHLQPGVAVLDLAQWTVREYSLEVPRSVGLYSHGIVSKEGNGDIYVLGGGGNCFSFGMHIATEALVIGRTMM